MIKTLSNLFKQDKEKFVVPKGVQDCIPIYATYDDGIFRVGKDKYSKSFKTLHGRIRSDLQIINNILIQFRANFYFIMMNITDVSKSCS